MGSEEAQWEFDDHRELQTQGRQSVEEKLAWLGKNQKTDEVHWSWGVILGSQISAQSKK